MYDYKEECFKKIEEDLADIAGQLGRMGSIDYIHRSEWDRIYALKESLDHIFDLNCGRAKIVNTRTVFQGHHKEASDGE